MCKVMKKVHFLGIGGSGASAIAAIAEAEGFEVTGCDLEPNNEFTADFKDSQLLKGHNPEHLNSHLESGKVDILAATPAVYSLDPDNEELNVAKERGIEVLTWQEFMGKYLQKDKFVIAVCGTHGKSTVTAMIGRLLEDAGLDPTVELGAIVPKWGKNYRIGQGKYFVTEADEFNDNYLPTKPDIAVITNIEMDHPEYFKDFEAVKESFKKFLLQTKSTIVANLFDPVVAEILKYIMKESKVTSFDYSNNRTKVDLNLKIPGDFNQLNAKAAFQIGLLLGIDPEIIKKSLENFTGVGRRFEHLGNYRGREVYTDFGHHPTEIKTTMEAARKKFKKKYIWLIFQPHMFSRTKGLFKEFVEAFKNLPINQILIMDIYPSREVDTGLVTGKQLAEAVKKSSVDFVSNENLKEVINAETQPGDILFFMGAGDIDKIARELVR